MAVLLTMAVTAKAQTQPINVVCTEGNAKYYAEDNDLYIVLQNAEYTFTFDIICAAGASDIVDGQTYTLADMIASYSRGADYVAQAYIIYSSVSLTRTNGSYVVDVTDTYSNQYHITYTQITEPTDTVVVDMTSGSYNRAYDFISTEGSIQLMGLSSDGYYMNVVFYADQFAGSYTLADRYESNDYFMLYSDYDLTTGTGTQIPCNNLLEATVTGTASNCTAHIKWVAADGTMYDISFAYADPTVQSQQTFIATDLTITQNSNYSIYKMYYGLYVYDFQASDGTNILYGTVYNENADDALGTWTFDNGETLEFNLYDATTGEASSAPFSGTITIAQAQDDSYTLTGTSLFYDNVEWTFNCSFNVTVEDTISIVMDNAEVNTILDYTSITGQYQLQGADQNQEYTMLLAINSDQIAGSYTQNDIDGYHSGLIHIVGGDTTNIRVLSIADFTVTGNAKSCSTYVEILGSDHNLYQITYTYTYVSPEPVDTIEITMDNENYNIVYDQTYLGMFQLLGADQNDEYRMRLVVYSDQVAGDYTMSDVETFYTELTHNTAEDTSYIEIEDIRDFKVVGNAKSCSTYVEIVSKDSVLYKITYSYTYTPLDTKDTIDITMDNATFNAVYDQTFANIFQLYGADSNDEYRMRMVIYSDQIAGNYTQSEVDLSYSYLAHCLPGDTTSIAIEEIRDFTVNGDEYGCTAYFEIISTDSVLYRINYSYSYGIKDTVDIVMDNENNRVYDVTATYGCFMLVGADQAVEYAMALMVVSDQMAGTYGAADIYDVELASISGTDTTYITLQRASAFTVEGDTTWCRTNLVFISEDSVMYRITFEYGEMPSAVENTVEETEFVVCSENNTIVVYGVEGQMMAVYDMAGRTIMNSKSTSDIERIDVAVPGIYVVRVAGKAAKVLVK